MILSLRRIVVHRSWLMDHGLDSKANGSIAKWLNTSWIRYARNAQLSAQTMNYDPLTMNQLTAIA